MPNSITSARRIRTTARQAVAVEMRAGGMTFRTIGLSLGVSRSAAHRLVRRALARVTRQTDVDARQAARLELERLDALLKAVWHRAMAGDARACATALRVIEMRCSLQGLDGGALPDDGDGPVESLPDADLERIARGRRSLR